jgi:hypothetical protein
MLAVVATVGALGLAACGGGASSAHHPDAATDTHAPSAARGVYMLGTTSPGACGGDALERIWPSRATSYYTGFDCYATQYGFRATDDQLFYDSLNMGMRVDVAGSADPVVATPPCADEVDQNFGFDGQGRLYYLCSNTLLRGNGETVATNVTRVFGVLADGRTIVTSDLSTNTAGAVFQVISPAGENVNLLIPDASVGGTTYPVGHSAATTVGNDGFVLVARVNDPDPPQVLVYHLDPQSHWELLRPVVGLDPSFYSLGLSDGTVIARGDDPQTGNNHIIAYLPGSDTPQEIWKGGDSPVVFSHTGTQLLMGPMDATGPSVMTE